MSFNSYFLVIRQCVFKRHINSKVLNSFVRPQVALFSNFVSDVSDTSEETKKKTKTPILPKITLISKDNVTVTTLEEAQKLSKRRDLKLVKIIDLDTKSQRPVYKLMTGAEYHAEDLKQREERKKEKNNESIKGEKVVMLNCGIAEHDLRIFANKAINWLKKRYEVRFVISGDASNMQKAETIYLFLENQLKNDGRILQKRIKGNDIKFHALPPKKDKDQLDNS